MKNKSIVKIQLSLTSSKYKRGVLVYNESNSIYYEAEASEEVIKFMAGRDIAYCWAWLEGTELVLDKPAPPQDW